MIGVQKYVTEWPPGHTGYHTIRHGLGVIHPVVTVYDADAADLPFALSINDANELSIRVGYYDMELGGFRDLSDRASRVVIVG